MAIERMSVAKISGNLKLLDAVLDEICSLGVYEPEQAQAFYSAGMGLVPFDEENTAAAKLAELEAFAKNSGITLKSKSRKEFEGAGESEKRFDEMSERLKKYADEKKNLEEQLTLCREAIAKYSHFKNLDVDLGEINACKYVKPRFGHMPKSAYEKILDYSKDHPYVTFFPTSFDNDECWGMYFAPTEKMSEVDGIFASLLFEQIIQSDVTGTIGELLCGLEANVELVEKQFAELDEKIAKRCREEEEHISLYYSKLSYEVAKQNIKSMAYHNDEYFFLAGWVPERHAKKLKEGIKKVSAEIDTEISKPDGSVKVKPPVKMKHYPKIIKHLVEPYNFYVDMYGTPSYNDIDVTPFVAITYTILFGMMFGDMGQGFVLGLVGFLMWKLKNMGLGKILIPCGISSMVFGFIFGSVFGYEHMLDPVYHALGWEGKPIEVFENVNLVLLIAIAIGVVLVVCAILLNIFACISRRSFGEALLSQNGLAGLILYLAGANLASGFMGGFSPVDGGVCGIVIAVCAVILIVKEPFIEWIDKGVFHKPESMMDFFLQNIFEFIEYVLSYLSNTVSFLRVGAFVLVHAGMMMVVFSLAGESENIVVVVLGNILVIALEGLLTGIQALRLEYYEMFSRFYIGDGRKFDPVKAKKTNK